jgi:uncharacterized protein (DUF1501 family)
MDDNSVRNCPGTLGRRAFVRSGLIGLGGLGLADLLRLEAAQAATSRPREKSVIVLWLWGGPSHMETFDLKPDAPSEYRGDFKPVNTNVAGIRICEHLPLLAKQAHRYALIRSCHHDSPGHVNSTHTVLTALKGSDREIPPYKPPQPDVWSVINRARGDWSHGVPPYIALPRVRYNGAAYLGSTFDPLIVTQDPNAAEFRVPDVSLPAPQTVRYARRASLLQRFDQMRGHVEASADAESLDAFQQRALDILTRNVTGKAFDLSSEDPKTRDRYGRHDVGQRCLLARRLVEAGARIVTIDFPCVGGQKAFSWDDHASVWNIFEQMKIRLPVLDQVVSALIDDLYERGLDKDVLFLVMGEMGRTPKLSNFNGQPGREHWGKAMSILLAGGGMPMGQVVGETNSLGEEPQLDPVTPLDLQATLYRYFGIPLDTAYVDQTGRPIPILPTGQPIRQLVG